VIKGGSVKQKKVGHRVGGIIALAARVIDQRREPKMRSDERSRMESALLQ